MKKSFLFVMGLALLLLGCKLESSPASPVVTGISVVQEPSQKLYSAGSKISFEGLIVAAQYDNGISGLVYDYTTDVAEGSSFSEPGSYPVTVSYKGFSASFSISVVEKLQEEIDASVTGIVLVQKPAKTAYSVESPVSFSGLIVAARYGSGMTSLIDDYETDVEDGASFAEAGTYPVTISYRGFTASFDITVVEQLVSEDVYLESISIFQKPLKTTYEQHQSLDLTGLIVMGTYSNGLNSLFLDYSVSPQNGSPLTELGGNTVTVSRGSLTATFTVNVVEEIIYGKLPSITISVAEGSDISISQSRGEGFVELTAPADYESYQWKVNSSLAGVEKDFVFNTSELVKGNYQIFLKAKSSDGTYRSATIYIQVE